MNRYLMRSLFFSLFFSFIYSFAQAQEVLNLQYNGKSTAADASTAKNEIFDSAIKEISEEHITALIGVEKTSQSKPIIENKILKDFSKYILSTKGGSIQKKGDAFEMTVDVRLSLKNLRSVLLKEGLLYQVEGPPKVLPVIRIVDRVGATGYSWWADGGTKENAAIRKLIDDFHDLIKSKFHGIGFYSVSPTASKMRENIPEAYRVEMPQRGDLLFLGQYLKTSLVLRGDIVIKQKSGTDNIFSIDYRITGLHSGNGRVMAEILRTYDTDPGHFNRVVPVKFKETSIKVAEDLSSQLSEAWKSGTFGANLYQLTMRSRMMPKDVDDFKNLLVLRVREIKSMHERLLQAGSVTYEVDSSAVPQQLAEVFRLRKFDQFKVEVGSVAPDGMSIEVSKN